MSTDPDPAVRPDHLAAALTWELIRHGFIQVRDPEHPALDQHRHRVLPLDKLISDDQR